MQKRGWNRNKRPERTYGTRGTRVNESVEKKKQICGARREAILAVAAGYNTYTFSLIKNRWTCIFSEIARDDNPLILLLPLHLAAHPLPPSRGTSARIPAPRIHPPYLPNERERCNPNDVWAIV